MTKKTDEAQITRPRTSRNNLSMQMALFQNGVKEQTVSQKGQLICGNKKSSKANLPHKDWRLQRPFLFNFPLNNPVVESD